MKTNFSVVCNKNRRRTFYKTPSGMIVFPAEMSVLRVIKLLFLKDEKTF